MAKKTKEALYIVDHANKQADRERINPNRRKLRALRAWDCVPEDSANEVRRPHKASTKPE